MIYFLTLHAAFTFYNSLCHSSKEEKKVCQPLLEQLTGLQGALYCYDATATTDDRRKTMSKWKQRLRSNYKKDFPLFTHQDGAESSDSFKSGSTGPQFQIVCWCECGWFGHRNEPATCPGCKPFTPRQLGKSPATPSNPESRTSMCDIIYSGGQKKWKILLLRH